MNSTPVRPYLSSPGGHSRRPARFPCLAAGLLALLWLAPAVHGALPVFENRTPVGFSRQDSTSKKNFVEGQTLVVRADLNQAATPTHPVIGHFHNLERSVQLQSGDVDGLRADLAISDEGVVHMAWIAQEVVAPVSTPVYFVRYARSNDQGKTFTDPVSVSGSLRFDPLTVDGGGTSFSTLDLELDSRGNPRVVYAFNASPDGKTARFAGNPNNVYFNYSETGGAVWLPGGAAVVVNDSATVGEGRDAAFPRMIIDQRDNIFISYVRGSTRGTGSDDIVLARVDRQTSPFTMVRIGPTGNAGSAGGVRLTPDAGRQTGPDIDVGTGDVLHLIYYDDAAGNIEHKTLLADLWNQVGASGWNQDVAGAAVDAFDRTAAGNPALETDAIFYFPTAVVDRRSSPDRIYAFYKFGDATFETVFFNSYVYDNAIGANAGWSTAQAAPVWSTAASPLFADGNQAFNIELDWTVTERVAAVVEERRSDRGEIHIAFSAGFSGGSSEHDIYYGFYNGVSWTLPEKVADDDSDPNTEDGIAAADVFLAAPALSNRPGDPNVYLAFAGGAAEGLGVKGVSDVNQHPYFKVLGRALSSEDVSVPVGGFQYDLEYTPINPHDISTTLSDNPVYVHVADNSDGTGLGATGKKGDGFLAGDWETVAATLADDDKFFEGRINEDSASDHEWGDDDDKVGLLVKLNVLGSDSATNVQLITNSTASGAGTGLGARSVRVGADPSGSFVSPGSFFLLGADIDIIDANTAPVVRITQPDGVADTANVSFPILYDLSDADDDISTGTLKTALYFSADSTLNSVQDVRIFGTLIADENDNSAVFASGTDDFAEGLNQSYTWDDPPAALKAKLFASIFQAISADYFIYLVADDQKNPPVFARSPGPLSVRHKPIVLQVDPNQADTVDTGVRSGAGANPFDLNFSVRDFDRQGATEVQLFFSAVSGLSSVSAIGTFPNQRFVLGKSLAGIRATPLAGSDSLTSAAREFSWDLTDSVDTDNDNVVDSRVAEGNYFLYVVASDSADITVGQSTAQLSVKHSPSFTFFEPPRDSQRNINSGSQSVFTIQWQKGPGDQDFDDNATIDLFFTTDNPATINYEDFPDSLLKDADTRVIVRGLTEDPEAGSDMFVWDLRNPPNDVPRENRKVWLYARISDDRGNSKVALGGALSMRHDPHITLLSSKLDDLTSFQKNDVLRITWDDYLVDDGSSTDDAYIRLYASTLAPATFTTLKDLDTGVDGTNTFLINSSNGNTTGTLSTIREDSVDFFDWNTRLFGSAGSSYTVYAGISKDPSFSDNLATTFSRSSTTLTLTGTGSLTNVSLSPTDQSVSIGDTLSFDVMIEHTKPLNFVQVVVVLPGSEFQVIDQSATAGTQPFLDLNNIFAGSNPIENQVSGSRLRFSKSSFTGEQVGSSTQPLALARFQLVAQPSLSAAPAVSFSSGSTGTVFGLVGQSVPVESPALSLLDPQLKRVSRGKITATVELEGRTAPLGSGDHTTLLDVHLRLPGSTLDLADADFRTANDDLPSSTDTVEVMTNASGALTLVSVPAGRYVLTVKDTSHVSGRSDTITIRNGETIDINTSSRGFFGSDLRGDPTSLLPSSGAQLIAGDVSEDNEINEDDVNLIIAAWGSNSSKPSFAQADINNDNVVGAADLTVTTSNFGNSEGFGAPPVFKRVAAGRGDNARATLELEPLFDPRRAPPVGGEAEVVVRARDLDELAGYEFELRFEAGALRLVEEGAAAGDIFAANPRGAVFEVLDGQERVRVMGARIGKEWSARGGGILARLRFAVLEEGALEKLRLDAGLLLNPRYLQQPVRAAGQLAGRLRPRKPGLEPNYPNPFNPSTTIPFAVSEPGNVRLAIYNMLGQRIRTLVQGPLMPGFHSLVWHGRDDQGRKVAAGVYFSLLEAGAFRQTRKMLLLK